MTLDELYTRRKDLIKLLNDTIDYRKKLSRLLPKAEREYRQAMSVMMVKLHNGEVEDIDKVAWTSCYDLAKGLNADLMFERDTHKYMMDTVQEKIYSVKLELRTIESDIESYRKGNV